MPSPSPTITSAVKLKRRPPLTTLDTRLMATTRSMKLLFSAGAPPGPRPPSRRSRRSLPPPAPPPRRCGPGIRRPSRSAQCLPSAECSSEVQPALARTVGQRRDAPGVPVATPVEDDGGDPRRLRPLGDQRADPPCQGGLVALGTLQAGVQRRGTDQGTADGVVDDLDVDVPGGPVDHEAGALRGAGDALAQPVVTAQPRGAARGADVGTDGLVHPGTALGVRCLCHHLPVFPTLRLTTSPWYRTPLPLYGSGLRIFRMLAATSPTCCLSMPLTRSRVGASTVKEIPSGARTTTGWLKPRANSRSDPRACTR